MGVDPCTSEKIRELKKEVETHVLLKVIGA